LGNLWITLLRPRIVASDQPTTLVAEGDYPISVLGYQSLVHRTSNVEPFSTLSLIGGVRCMRSSHVAPAERLEIAHKLYEALLAQGPDRVITLCDGDGRVVACHRPRP